MKQNNKQKGALLISFFLVFVIGFVGGSLGTYFQKQEEIPFVSTPKEKEQVTLQKRESLLKRETEPERLQPAEGRAMKSHRYYLKNLGGMVVVYEDNQVQPYLVTDIRVEDLPINLQEKMKEKLEIADEKSLYDFLESYTS